MSKPRKNRPANALRRRLHVESLESRQLLAGNVTLSLTGGVLTITGDAQANEIFIGDLGNQRFSIRGLAGTTVNGSDAILYTSAPGNETSGIVVNLGDGDDRVLLSADSDWLNGTAFSQGWSGGGFKPLLYSHGFAQLAGHLTINLGNGNDTAVITASAVMGITIDGGSDAGDDGVFLRTNSSINVSVLSAAGKDTVLIAFRTAPNLSVDTGDGNDAITIEGGNVFPGLAGSTPVNGTLNTITVRSGSGDDSVSLNQLFANNLDVDAGLGLDDVKIQGVNLRGNATIRGGGTLGSNVTVSELVRNSFGRIDSMFSQPAVTEIETRIGGNVSISFNFELYVAPPNSSTTPENRVTVGVQYPYSTTDYMVIGGAIQVFGTIYEDNIRVTPLRAGSLQSDGGNGEDTITVSGVDVTGNINLLLGEGNDRGLIVEDAAQIVPNGVTPGNPIPLRIGGNLVVDYGNGNEVNSVETFAIGSRTSGLTSNFVVAGKLQVSGGNGSKALNVRGARFGNVELRLGRDASTQLDMHVVRIDGFARIFGGIGPDDWKLDALDIGGDLSCLTGDGNDVVQLDGAVQIASHVGGSLLVDTGAGNDDVQLGFREGQTGDSLFIDNDLTIRTGTNDDEVSLQQAYITDALLAQLGAGDDTMWMNNVQAKSGEADGGPGMASLSGQYKGTSNSALVRRNFQFDILSDETVTTIAVRLLGENVGIE